MELANSTEDTIGTKTKKTSATKTTMSAQLNDPTISIPRGRGARPGKPRKVPAAKAPIAAPEAPTAEPGVLVRIDDGVPTFDTELLDEKTAIQKAQQERLAFDTTAKITKLHQDYGAENLELTERTRRSWRRSSSLRTSRSRGSTQRRPCGKRRRTSSPTGIVSEARTPPMPTRLARRSSGSWPTSWRSGATR
jgi:hypothetical protein